MGIVCLPGGEGWRRICGTQRRVARRSGHTLVVGLYIEDKMGGGKEIQKLTCLTADEAVNPLRL